MNNCNKVYSGGAFHRSLPKGKKSGSLLVDPSGIEFHNEGTRLRVPFDGMRVKRGGAADQLIFFNNSGVKGLTIYSDEERILDNPYIQGRTNLVQQIQKLRAIKWQTPTLVVLILAMVAALIVGVFYCKEPLVLMLAKKVPVSWENELGEVVYKQLVAGGRILNDDWLNGQLQAITNPLKEVLPNSPYNFRFNIVEDSQVNALAVPGGNIIIYTGLLAKSDSPEEIAGVLAHEMAHVTCRHSIRQMIGASGIYLLVQSLIGDMTGLLAIIADSGTFLLTQKFSREYEKEADETGWNYLIQANIDPTGMVSFFEKLRATEESVDRITQEKIVKESLDFLSTHPATEDRIQYLNEKLSNLPVHNFVPIDLNFQEFQERIDELTSESYKRNR